VKHPIGLSEPKRTKDDRLGFVGAAGHAESLETSSAGSGHRERGPYRH
jgi:hypothetical protein